MRAILLVAVLLVSGCYSGPIATGRFTKTKVDDKVWIVRYRGNALLHEDRAHDFLLLHGAELALDNGCPYFALLNEEDKSTYKSYTEPTTSMTLVHTPGMATTTTGGGETRVEKKFGRAGTLFCFEERPENPPGLVYNSKIVLDGVAAKYRLVRVEDPNKAIAENGGSGSKSRWTTVKE